MTHPNHAGTRRVPKSRVMVRLLLICVAATSLAACSGDEQQGLLDELKALTGDARGKIDPLPVITPYKPFAYEVSGNPDPFGPAKIQLAVKAGSRDLAPDAVRPREALEAFPIERIAMVGTITQKSTVFAVVRADGTLYRVKTGNYIGPNFGKIVSITDAEIVLTELVQDSTMEWAERKTVIALQ
jgi:type IV pilus assembly protein PilP